MKKRVIYFLSVISLCSAFHCVDAYAVFFVDFNDGGIHEINSGNSTGQFELVRVDYGYPGMGTTLNIVTGGKIAEALSVFENGNTNLLGGEISGNLFVYDDSRAIIYEGIIGEFLHSGGNSWVTVLGGVVGTEVDAFENSQIDISGGTFSYVRADGYGQLNISGGSFGVELRATQNSVLTISGSNFTIDDIPVEYGTVTASTGILGGILTSGETIDVPFYTHEDAVMILVPEPAMILLLGLGALLLRKRTYIGGKYN